MESRETLERRLRNQRLTGATLERAADVVAWFGAMQAQDYAAAAWAVGQRMATARDRDIDDALANGSIVRTHILRPTWHFVAREDMRWMLALSGPRLVATSTPRQRQLGIDEAMAGRAAAALADALRGGRFLTRAEAMVVLEEAGIAVDGEGQRLPWLLMRAEFEGVICSGPRVGKQFTYALLDERVPMGEPMSGDDALAELARRYFRARGPATAKDLAWWSGLTLTDCRRGIETVRDELCASHAGKDAHWWPKQAALAEAHNSQSLHLLAAFDEYTVAYADRRSLFDGHHASLGRTGSDVLTYVIVGESGEVVGTWRRSLAKDLVRVVPTFFESPTDRQRDGFVAAASRYAAFLGRELKIEW